MENGFAYWQVFRAKQGQEASNTRKATSWAFRFSWPTTAHQMFHAERSNAENIPQSSIILVSSLANDSKLVLHTNFTFLKKKSYHFEDHLEFPFFWDCSTCRKICRTAWYCLLARVIFSSRSRCLFTIKTPPHKLVSFIRDLKKWIFCGQANLLNLQWKTVILTFPVATHCFSTELSLLISCSWRRSRAAVARLSACLDT